MSKLSQEHLFTPESSFQEESSVEKSSPKKEKDEEINEVYKDVEDGEQLNEDRKKMSFLRA